VHSKIIHYHIAKTGGTTLNNWLDTLVPSNRARPAERGPEFTASCSDASWLTQTVGNRQFNVHVRNVQLGREARSCWDVIHDHNPGVVTARGNAYQIVILRHPVERFLSCLRDWRRLHAADVSAAPEREWDIRRAARELSADAFVRDFGDHPVFKEAFHDVQMHSLRNVAIHALSRGRITALEAENRNEPERTLDMALAKTALLEVFDLVGVTESLDLVAKCLARDLGAAPPPLLDRYNSTVADSARDLLSEPSRRRLLEFNQGDLALYHAAQIRLSEISQSPYDEAAFEAEGLPLRLAQLSPKRTTGGRSFSMNDQIVGAGFHGRDARDTDIVNVWTGPGTRAILYMPVPPQEYISVFLDINGHMENPGAGFHRSAIRISCDGDRMPFFRQPAEGLAERIVIPIRTIRPFVKIEIFLDKTWTATEIGLSPDDVRRRGLGLRGYGYSLSPISPSTALGDVSSLAETMGVSQPQTTSLFHARDDRPCIHPRDKPAAASTVAAERTSFTSPFQLLLVTQSIAARILQKSRHFLRRHASEATIQRYRRFRTWLTK
jgi:hypothetical protein